jgi:hypothetical protein
MRTRPVAEKSSKRMTLRSTPRPTGQIPRLALVEINFSNNIKFNALPTNFPLQVKGHQFLVCGVKPEPGWQSSRHRKKTHSRNGVKPSASEKTLQTPNCSHTALSTLKLDVVTSAKDKEKKQNNPRGNGQAAHEPEGQDSSFGGIVTLKLPRPPIPLCRPV